MTQSARYTIALALGLLTAVPAVWAQSAAPAPTQSPTTPPAAAPSVGQTWSPTVSQSAPAGSTATTLDPAQTEGLNIVSKYFNDLKQLKGAFLQTNPDGKRLRGKFAIKQPGRFRFDYGSGSKMVIISDGTYLAIQDLDMKTDDRVELDRTPFRILLRKDVDLIRDARIYEVQNVDDLIIVTLADRSPDAPGKIRLFLSKKPELELKEWVTTDAQGLDTKIEVSGLSRTEPIDDAQFKPSSVALQKIQ